MSEDEAMADEFDTVAWWTASAVAELGEDHALPAACRGSGSPAALDWLATSMGLREGLRLLDSGAGVGGPAEHAARSYGVRPTLAEPMEGACRAARRAAGSRRVRYRSSARASPGSRRISTGNTNSSSQNTCPR